ncbi:hypothetical protein DIPPA_07315 [Diplonema papillatum]|nr:hypothetical protein DIPPA_07315 [Diplonema papillatum]
MLARGGNGSAGRMRDRTMAMLAKENETLALDSSALLREQQAASEQAQGSRLLAADYSQRNVVLADEAQATHRSLAATNDEKHVLLREKAELTSANRIMLQRISKLESLNKSRDDSVKEINSVLQELRRVKSELQTDNSSLKRDLRDKEKALHSLENEMVAGPPPFGPYAVGGFGGIPSSPRGSPRPPAHGPHSNANTPRAHNNAAAAGGGGAPPYGAPPSEVRHNVQQRLMFLENVNKSLQSDNASLSKSLDHLQASISTLRQHKMDDVAEIDALTQDFEEEKKENSRLHADLLDFRRERESLEAKLSEKEDTINRLTADLHTAIGPKGNFTAKVQKLEKEVEDKAQRIQSTAASIDQKTHEAVTLRSALQEEQAKVSALRAQLEVAGANQSSAAEQWQEEAEYAAAQVRELRAKHTADIDALKQQYADRGASSESAAAKTIELEAAVASLERIVEQKDAGLHEATARHVRLEAELRQAEAESREKAAEILRHKEDFDAMASRLHAESGRIRDLEGVIQERDDEASDLRAKLHARMAGDSESESKEASVRLAEEQVADMRRELEASEFRLKAKSAELTEREQRVRDMEERMRTNPPTPAAAGELGLLKKNLEDKEHVYNATVKRLSEEIEMLTIANQRLESENEAAAAAARPQFRAFDPSSAPGTPPGEGLYDYNHVTRLEQDLHELQERERKRRDAPTPITATEELGRLEGIIDRLQTENEELLCGKGPLTTQIEDLQDALAAAQHDLRTVRETVIPTYEERVASAEVELRQLRSDSLRQKRPSTPTLQHPPPLPAARESSVGSSIAVSPQGSKRAKKEHKMQLWQAQALIDSWKADVARFFRMFEAAKSVNRALEAELMRSHDRSPAPSSSSPPPAAALSARAPPAARGGMGRLRMAAALLFVSLAAAVQIFGFGAVFKLLLSLVVGGADEPAASIEPPPGSPEASGEDWFSWWGPGAADQVPELADWSWSSWWPSEDA